MTHRLTVALTFLILAAGATRAEAQIPIHWSISRPDTTPVVAGKTFNVTVTAKIDAGWHLYGLTEPAGGPNATVITVGKGPFSLAGEIAAEPPLHALDPQWPDITEEMQFYEDHAAFTLPLRAAATMSATDKVLVIAHYQTCNDRLCQPPTDVDLTLDLASGGSTAMKVGRNGSLTAIPPAGTSIATATPIAPGAAILSAGTAKVLDMSTSTTASTLGSYIGLAALMGALSLLTPCVFPMVPITVSYFTKRAGRNHRESVIQALIYGTGIVLTFTAVGFILAVFFGASGLNRFAADPWLNLGVTALFVAFALSLFGIFELTLPSGLVNAASRADRGKGRHVGALLMGLAFTLTSFTCTAPFLGTLLVLAAQGQWLWPLAGMLAFSSVFALPFVILALAPQLVASLPRSGMWLLSVKATMGLLELAAAMKFLSNVDLVWGWGIFTRNTVLVVWVVIGAILTLYLFGLLKLGYAPRLKRPGVGRALTALGAVALSVWLATGLSGRGLGELEAFLPPASLTGSSANGEMSWIVNDYDAGLKEAQRQNRPIFVDFTGYTCTNCRWMEANMFPKPEVARELSRYVRVRLYTDGKGELFARFQQMQQDRFGTVALPYYAVLKSDGQPVVTFGGLTRNPDEFLRFLRKGLE